MRAARILPLKSSSPARITPTCRDLSRSASTPPNLDFALGLGFEASLATRHRSLLLERRKDIAVPTRRWRQFVRATLVVAPGQAQGPPLLERRKDIAVPTRHWRQFVRATLVVAPGQAQGPPLIERRKDIAVPTRHWRQFVRATLVVAPGQAQGPPLIERRKDIAVPTRRWRQFVRATLVVAPGQAQGPPLLKRRKDVAVPVRSRIAHRGRAVALGRSNDEELHGHADVRAAGAGGQQVVRNRIAGSGGPARLVSRCFAGEDQNIVGITGGQGSAGFGGNRSTALVLHRAVRHAC